MWIASKGTGLIPTIDFNLQKNELHNEHIASFRRSITSQFSTIENLQRPQFFPLIRFKKHKREGERLGNMMDK